MRIPESILGPKNNWKAGAHHGIKQVGKLASSGKDTKYSSFFQIGWQN